MKLKRIIAALFATTFLLAPVSASESALSCRFCNRNITWSGFTCGGINASYDEYTNCDVHGWGTCKILTRYGYTNYECSQGCQINDGYHECHIHHVQNNRYVSTEVVCDYGDYPG